MKVWNKPILEELDIKGTECNDYNNDWGGRGPHGPHGPHGHGGHNWNGPCNPCDPDDSDIPTNLCS